jgi:apolipoprotein N-acyltransferase
MRAFLAVAISACLYYSTIGLGEFWPGAWIAPIPILLLAFRSSWRTAALAAFAAYFLGSLNVLAFMARIMPAALVLTLLAATALMFAAAVVIGRAAVSRLPGWAAVFAFPAAWTTYEFVTSLVSPHGTAMSLAYSQAGFPPVLQIASVTGIWGITFVVTLVPCAVAVAWVRRSAAAMVPALAIALAVFGYGAVRLQQRPQAPLARVGLAATDQGIGAAFETGDPAKALAVAHAYADRVTRLAAQGAQVVVLPEKFVGVTPADSDAVAQVFRDAARAAHVTVIAGFNRFSLHPPRNPAVVFAPDGRVILEYEKHHMLPGPETGYEIGVTPGLLPGPGVPSGVAICKDMDFQAWSRQYGQRGVRILYVPAWDFIRDARQHSRMAVLRGVEEGFTIARAAQEGNLTFSDAYGRVLAETSSSQMPDAALVADIPAGPGPTVYTRFGDWFGWLCVMALAGVCLLLTSRPTARQ